MSISEATDTNNVTIADIAAAAERIRPYAHRTPVFSSHGINELVGAKVCFKAENMQKVGAFKFRGACNAVFSLSDEEVARGVITHSSGNHAAALALAARLRGCEAVIVMPDNAPTVKKDAVASYGARIEFCDSNEEAREAAVRALQAQRPRELVHPFNDVRIVAGQGTAARELLEDYPDLQAVFAPVGGGGLLSGTAIAAKAHGATVYGAEPAAADDAARSLRAGKIIPVDHPRTIADGLRTSLGPVTFAIIRRDVNDIVTVSERAIIRAMRLLWERLKLVVEPSGAVPLAVLLEHGVPSGVERVGVILSGGNVDLGRLPWANIPP